MTKLSPTQEVMQKVKLLRVKANLTQHSLAYKVGVAQSTWSLYEHGKRSISLESLLMLPAILECSIADILPDSVVTAVDQRRSKDFKLEEIAINWVELSDEHKLHVLNTFRLMLDADRANTQREKALHRQLAD